MAVFNIVSLFLMVTIANTYAGLPPASIKNIDVLSETEIKVTFQIEYDKRGGNKRNHFRYMLRYKPKGGKYSYLDLPSTERTLTGLFEDTLYVFSVRTIRGDKSGEWSPPEEARTAAVETDNSNGIVNLQNITLDSVVITWPIPANQTISGYKVSWRKGKQGSGEDLFVQIPPVKIINLEPETKYAASVFMLFAEGGKDKISTVKFVTRNLDSLKMPENLRVKVLGSKKLLVKWKQDEDASAEAVGTGYVLQYKRRGSSPTEMCEVELDKTDRKYIIKGLREDNRYGVRIRSRHNNYTGPFTEWAFERLLPGDIRNSSNDKDLRAYSISPSEVVVFWEEDLTDSDDRLLLELNKDYEFVTQVSVRGRTSFIFQDLEPNSRYTVVLKEFTVDCPKNRVAYVRTRKRVKMKPSEFNNIKLTYIPYLRLLTLPNDVTIVTWTPLHIADAFVIIKVFDDTGGKDHQLGTHVAQQNFNHLQIDIPENGQRHSIQQLVFDTNVDDIVFVADPLIVLPDESGTPATLPTLHPVSNIGGINVAALSSVDVLLWRNESDPDTNATASVSFTLNETVIIKSYEFHTKSSWALLSYGSEMVYNITLWLNESAESVLINTSRPVPPQMAPISDVELVEDTATRIKCSADGDPYPTITWRKGDSQESLTTNDDHLKVNVRYITSLNGHKMETESLLRLTKAKPSHTDKYECIARNVAGESTVPFRIKVKAKPPKPVKNLYGYAPTPYEIRVEWFAPDDPFPFRLKYDITVADADYETILNVTTINLFHVLIHLEPATMYQIDVQSSNDDSKSVPMRIKVKTLPLPSLDPPQDVTLTTHNSSFITITWRPPLEIIRNFLVLHTYQVQYRLVSTKRSIVRNVNDSTSCNLYELAANELYEVRVLANTVDGQVSFTGWLKGSTYRESYLIETRPPAPPADVFVRTEGTQLQVTWLHPVNELGILIRKFAVDVYKNGTLEQSLAVNYEESSIVIDSDVGVEYTIAVKAINNAGASPAVERKILIPDEVNTGWYPPGEICIFLRRRRKMQISPGGYHPVFTENRLDVTHLPVAAFKAYPISSTGVMLVWGEPETGRYSHFQLTYSELDSVEPAGSGNLPARSRQYAVRSLKPFTKYYFEIIPFFKHKEGVAAAAVTTTYSAKPTGVPSNLSMAVINATSLLLKASPPFEGKNGEIVEYKIVYRSENERHRTIVNSNSDEDLYCLLTDLTPNTVYQFKVHAESVNGSGPGTEWKSIRTPPLPKPVPPSQPTSLMFISTTDTITVAWTPDRFGNRNIQTEGYVVGYGRYLPEVYRAIVPVTQSNYTIQNLDAGTKYIVSVRSFNRFGESKAVFDLASTNTTTTE